MIKTFAEFKQDFYSRFTDASIFDCDDFNTIKIVLDGLKVDYNQYNYRPTLFLDSWLLYSVLRKIKFVFSWKKKNLKIKNEIDVKLRTMQNKKYLVGYTSRTIIDENNNLNNIYFSRIINDLGTENCIYVNEDNSYNNKFPAIDFLKQELMIAPLFHKHSSNDKLLHDSLLENYNRLKILKIFSNYDLKNIKTAYDLFFHQYKVWDYLFEKTNIKAIVVTVHYHKEGLVYAAKKRNIKVVELQHGLIADEDIFYMLPQKVKPVLPKALFADYIMVYGNSWKNILQKGAEYLPEQIKTIGYYHYQKQNATAQEQLISSKIGDKKVALFTTQTFLESTFIAYLKSIQNNIPNNFVVIIKPHPSENKQLYFEAFKDLHNIIIADCSLDFILEKATFNATCYSTTVFDALRYNVKSFAINFEQCKDYVKGFEDKKVVVKIEPTQNVFDEINTLNNINIVASDWYANYNVDELKAIL